MIKPDSYFEGILDRNGLLGQGTSRIVYSARGRDDVVIKEQRKTLPCSNLVEWIVWNALKKMGEDILGNATNPELKLLFAECFEISESGRYLMMERLGKLDDTNSLQTAKWPDWLNDKKSSAFGTTATGEIKAMDYGMVDFYHVLNPKNNVPFF